jgi:tRNA pseudouridine32 synthase/23S rRNA pseudouridine746 synthase
MAASSRIPTELTSRASYIDQNSELEAGKLIINSGLGRETLLYADEDILVYDKAANTQTAPGYSTRESLAVNAAKVFNVERVDQMIAHRLDHATSGVLIFARNVDALKDLHHQFRLNRVRKLYTALVDGVPKSFEGEIELPIQRDMESRPRVKISADGKESRTSFTVQAIAPDKKSSMVLLRPFTGRTHQLRIHLASIGHPILGDFFYAPPEVYTRSPERLCLHAKEITFVHPRTKQGMRFTTKENFGVWAES